MTKLITVSEDQWDKLQAVYEAAKWQVENPEYGPAALKTALAAVQAGQQLPELFDGTREALDRLTVKPHEHKDG